MKFAKKIAIAALIAAGAASAAGAMVLPQDRDPAYAAARAAGQVGEQPDGYIGIVGEATPQLRALVSDINIRRKAIYTRGASEEGSTVEQFAFVTGCRLIVQTEPGEKYQAPDGRWLTRDDSAPIRDSRCI
ncbi:YdbL family protein [Stakelama tenebrarum]|uniref:YdbL family protein n=1 Tax=Stakelama tenebrarum TaxID=2711215 RepID=A0A6G6Y2Q8_9SPHN|nr:YdbL family protein [Sphingosinithalassobacter tenebrarum]QIG79234.1 YdbL family protein [Sphingosinithalassobacter tenebrarum]